MVRLYAKYPFVREQANAHKTYQEALVTSCKLFKEKEILQNIAELLSLIPDQSLIKAAIKEIFINYLVNQYLFETEEMSAFFNTALSSNKEVIIDVCQNFLNVRPTDDEINVIITNFHQNPLKEDTDLKELLHILLISDITLILEEIPESKFNRTLIFENMKNFNKDDAENIKKSIRQLKERSASKKQESQLGDVESGKNQDQNSTWLPGDLMSALPNISILKNLWNPVR